MRKGQSMFSPFREQIEKWCDEGLTIRQMIEQLPPGYEYQSLRSYIVSNRIRDGAYGREINARNVCNLCEYCHKVKNVMGTYNVADNRICTKSWRLIQYSVRHCPTWCEKVVENGE